MKIRYIKNLFITFLLSMLVSNISKAQKNVTNYAEQPDSVLLFQKSNYTNIGFDTQLTTHVTSSISTVLGSDLEKNFSLNFGNTLFGRVAGYQ